jgi:hypothetical protein
MTENTIWIECSFCKIGHGVVEGNSNYKCPHCGRTNHIVWAASIRYDKLKESYDLLAADVEKLKNASGLSSQQEKFDQLIRQVNAMSEQVSLATQIELKLERQHYVPLNLSRNLSIADNELSAALACSTLFLGLFVQEWMGQADFSAVVIALLIATLTLSGITIYCFQKMKKAKEELEQAKIGTQTYTVISSQTEKQ